MCRDCCHFSKSEQLCSGHCGYESDGLVCDEFCDKNNETMFHTDTSLTLIVHYHTRCGTCTAKKEEVGFWMVFTAYKLNAGHDSSCVLPSEFKCDNGRCIWSGLTCDGYNNCGDNSDENNSGNSHCAEFPNPVKAVIVGSAVIVTVLLGVVLAYLPKMSFHLFLRKRRSRAFRISQRNEKKKPIPPSSLPQKKPSHSRTVSFQTPLPQIRELSISESEV
nr:low-density lipoprotein receptor-related protein 2-like [Parasteatoda tepidariorum]